MERIRRRLPILYFCLIFLTLLFSGCATIDLEKRVQRLETLIIEIGDEALMLEAAETGAPTKIYGRTALLGSTKSVKNIPCGAVDDHDIVFVIDSTLHELYFYWYDDDGDDTTPGAEESPYILEPNDVDSSCSGDGRWRLSYGIHFNSSSDGPGKLTLLEDDDNSGHNYYRLTVPSSIVTNEVFVMGNWRVDTSINDPSGDTSIEVDETKTIYNIGISGISANRQIDLPAASGSGVIFAFTLNDDNGSYSLQIDPDGSDQILGATDTGGDYLGADTEGDTLVIVDCASGDWCVVGIYGTWTEES